MNEPHNEQARMECPNCDDNILLDKNQVEQDQTFYEGRCDVCKYRISLCIEDLV